MAGPLGFQLAGQSFAPGDVVPVWEHLQAQHIFSEVGQGRLEIRRYPAGLAHLKGLAKENEAQLKAIQEELAKATAQAEMMAATLEALGEGLLGLAGTLEALKGGRPLGAQMEALATSAEASSAGLRKVSRKKASRKKAQS